MLKVPTMLANAREDNCNQVPTIPVVQSCRPVLVSSESPSTLSLYIDCWKAVAHAALLLANSVNASPEVVLGLARFTSAANR
jgi:hypothetical protein